VLWRREVRGGILHQNLRRIGAELGFDNRLVLFRRLAIVAGATIMAALLSTFRTGSKEITRFIVAPPPGATIGVAESRALVAMSPDGRRLAFVATSDGRQQIWVRSLDSLTSYPVAGTDDGVSPFWSPDSRFIGFIRREKVSSRRLRRLAVRLGRSAPLIRTAVQRGDATGPSSSCSFARGFSASLQKAGRRRGSLVWIDRGAR